MLPEMTIQLYVQYSAPLNLVVQALNWIVKIGGIAIYDQVSIITEFHSMVLAVIIKMDLPYKKCPNVLVEESNC